MSHRFYSDQPITGDRAVLGGPEAHHLLHVMRANAGDRISLFDGSGAEFLAEVASTGRADLELTILDRREIDRELPLDVTLGVALPKGDRQKWLVEKLTELGATRLVPLVTERSVAQPSGKALARLQRTVIEASKQCGRNRLMEIETAARWDEFAKQHQAPMRLLGLPGGAAAAGLLREDTSSVAIAIGPEGGFSDGEVELGTAMGWQGVDLGPRILRIETAAVALTSAVALRR